MHRLFLAAILCSVTVFASAQQQDNSALRDSLSTLIRSIDKDPGNLELRLRKASLNVLLEQYDYALEEYDRILKTEENNPAALFYRAYVHEKMNNLPFARKDYETLIKCFPKHFEANLGLAILAEKEKHFTEALDRINMLVMQFPDSAVAYAARGNMELSRGMFNAALYDFDEAVNRDGNNLDYRLGRVEALLGMEERKKAKEELDEILTLGVAKPQLADYYRRCRLKS